MMNMFYQDYENVPLMWKPSTTEFNEEKKRFLSILKEKYNANIGDYWDFHKWSVEHLEEFWAEIWNFSGIIYSKNFEKVIDLSIPMSAVPKWFEGARLNYAENLLKNRNEKTAIIFTGEDRETKEMTYNEVYETAQLYAAAFRKFGLKKGDRVACFMSNREEPVLAALGAASIGAIFTGTIPIMGAEAAVNVFKQVSPRIMLTVDRFRNNGEEIEMLHKVQKIASELQCLEKVIIVTSKEKSKLKDISRIKNSCFLDEFLQLGFEKDGSVPPIVFEQLPMSHPVYISFTSGTTGLPKPIMHGCGILLESAKKSCLARKPAIGLKSFIFSPVGWVAWNMTVTWLFSGNTFILYEGTPFFQSPTYLWDLVDKFKLPTLLLFPNVLDELEKRNYIPTDKHNLETLTEIVCVSNVAKPNNYDFVYNKIRKNVVFFSKYATTELMGECMTFDPTLPVHKGEIPCPALGFDLECLDDSGKSVVGEVGELVIKKPAPSLPLGIWGDSDGSRFRETYFPKYGDKYALGDLGSINPITKGIRVYCRSDGTLKSKGARFSSTDIYNIVHLIPEIHDSLCVSQYSKNKDERVVLFVQMKEGYPFNEELIERIRSEIKKGLSELHVPELILETKDIPYSLNWKKMDILVKKIINNLPYNADTVVNPDSLEIYKNILPYED